MNRFTNLYAVIAGLLMLGLAVPIAAQPREGNNEIEASGGYFRSVGSDSGNMNADLGYGYFLTDNWEVGLRQGLSYTFNDGTSDIWLATTAPFADYHFTDLIPNDTFVPFIGGIIGGVWNEDDLTGTAGGSAGFKAFVTESTYFVTRYRYEWFFDELDDANETLDANHVVSAGFGYQWQ